LKVIETARALSALCTLLAVCAAGDEVRTIALTDPSAFRGFSSAPVIDDAGQVALVGSTNGASPASSIWMESPGGLRQVAVAGMDAPGTGASFAQFSDLVAGGESVVAFKAVLTGGSANDRNNQSIWLEQSSTLQLIARTDQPVDGISDELRLARFEGPVALGGTIHQSLFVRTRDKEEENILGSGLLINSAGAKQLAAHANDPAISGTADVVFSPQGFEAPFSEDPIISPTGQTIFRGFLDGPGIEESNLNGLWSFLPGTGLQLLLRGGDAAPNTGGGAFVSFPSVPTINKAGDTAFLAFFEDLRPDHHDLMDMPGSGSGDDHDHGARRNLGLWLRRASGEVARLFAIGDSAPDISGEVAFVDSFNPVLNARGRVAVVAVVDGEGIDATNEIGLWSSGRSADQSLELVVRQGDPAPGAPEGFTFGVVLPASLNAAGQTVFTALAHREPPGEPVESILGIWGQDRTGRLRLVAYEGQWLEVAPGDVRQVDALRFTSATGGEDGKPRGMNDRGDVTWWAGFTDGTSGVFASRTLAAPEPGTMGMSAPILVVLLIGHRCRLRRARFSVPNGAPCHADDRQIHGSQRLIKGRDIALRRQRHA
jgi:hypothetical protein